LVQEHDAHIKEFAYALYQSEEKTNRFEAIEEELAKMVVQHLYILVRDEKKPRMPRASQSRLKTSASE
jgi:hypothetical protein